MGHSSIDHPIIRAIQFPSSLLSRVYSRFNCSVSCLLHRQVHQSSTSVSGVISVSGAEFSRIFYSFRFFFGKFVYMVIPLFHYFKYLQKLLRLLFFLPVYIFRPLSVNLMKSLFLRLALSVFYQFRIIFQKIVLLTLCISLYLLRKKSLGAVHPCI